MLLNRERRRFIKNKHVGREGKKRKKGFRNRNLKMAEFKCSNFKGTSLYVQKQKENQKERKKM